MPKTTSTWLLKHYPPLQDIEPDEWDEVFHRASQPWEPEEDEYVREWYGREPALTTAYALGRTPWTVQQRARKLGIHTLKKP